MNRPIHPAFRNIERLAAGSLNAYARFSQQEHVLARLDLPVHDLLVLREERLLAPFVKFVDLNPPLEPALANLETETPDVPATDSGSRPLPLPDSGNPGARPHPAGEPAAPLSTAADWLFEASGAGRRRAPISGLQPHEAFYTEAQFRPALTSTAARERWNNRIAEKPPLFSAWNQPMAAAPASSDLPAVAPSGTRVGQAVFGAVAEVLRHRVAPLSETRIRQPGLVSDRIEEVLRIVESGQQRGTVARSRDSARSLEWQTANRARSTDAPLPSMPPAAATLPADALGTERPASDWPAASFESSGRTLRRETSPGLAGPDSALVAPSYTPPADRGRAGSTVPQARGLRRLWEMGERAAPSISEVSFTRPASSASAEGAPRELVPHSFGDEELGDAVARILRREAEREGIDLEDLGP